MKKPSPPFYSVNNNGECCESENYRKSAAESGISGMTTTMMSLSRISTNQQELKGSLNKYNFNYIC